MDEEVKREIILDNYSNPFNREVVTDDKYIKVNTNNESCIDNIDLYILIENDIIKDIKFSGEACAISTSATSIMIKSLINKTITEVKEFYDNFDKMVNNNEYNQELLEENNVYNEIYKQANRKNCALLPWKAIMKGIMIYEKH